MVATDKANITDVTSTIKSKAIKGVGIDGDKVDDVDIININSTKCVKVPKLAKSKILV